MQFKENAVVSTSDGQKVGRIDRVVISPESKELTHIVVKKGLLFTEDKVVAVDHVDATSEDQVILKSNIENPDELPNFEESHYIPAFNEDERIPDNLAKLRPLAWYYPLPGAPWWRFEADHGYGKPPYLHTTELNIPDGTVPLEEGAEVLTRDGEHVGDVERVYSEPDENRVTHLLVSKGFISKEKKLVPTMWVDNVLEDRVRLAVEKEIIERLPAYSPSD